LSATDDPERRDGFLARWSRRKREEASEAKPGIVEAEVTEEAEEDFDLSLLPDIESITAESDITLFFRKGVPEALKNAALRKIWTADPAIRDFVAPADFQWDFNAPDGVPGFGPLGGDLDLKSMLRQAVGEPMPEASRGSEAAAPELPAESSGDLAPDPESLWNHDEGQAQDAIPEHAEQPLQEVSVLQELSSDNASSAIEAGFGTKLPVPARKHGSALPT